ncbi:MAG: hypothetical protein ACOC8A_01960 [bacterium]
MNAVRLDGTGRDPVWVRARKLPALELPAEMQLKPRMASAASVVRSGPWLLLALSAEERGAIIARESVPGVPMWLDDAFHVELEAKDKLLITANPLGGVYCTRNGREDHPLLREGHVRRAARIFEGGWRAEVAIDLRQAAPGASELGLRLLRLRQARSCVEPYEEPRFPATPDAWARLVLGGEHSEAEVAIDEAPPQRFVGRLALEAGLCEALPGSADEWARTPARLLSEENGSPPLAPAFQATEVRAAVSRTHIAFRVRCKEAFPDSIQDAGTAIWREDNVELFLGPERYAYLQVLVSPSGKFETTRGRPGGRRVRTVRLSEPPQVTVEKGPKEWRVEATIPIKAVLDVAEAAPRLHPTASRWVAQVTRNRPEREALGQARQASVLSVTRSATAHCPLRFAELRVVQPSPKPVPSPKLAAPELPAPVLNAQRRQATQASEALWHWIERRKQAAHQHYEDAFARIADAAGWKEHAGRIRENLLRSIFPATDGTLPPRTALHAETVYDHPGEGFRCQGIIYQSRPGLAVPVTLFVPWAPPSRGVKAQKGKGDRPALIMVPAQHTGRNSPDLLILGAAFARGGGIALAIESIGSGERLVSSRFAHKREQRNLVGSQLLLAGETLEGWTAWDISRAVDYLVEREDVDPGRIAIVGGVAGGGDVSALAAAVDERIAVSIPFNFCLPRPFEGYSDSLRAYFGANAGGLTPWMTDALVAPRYLLQAQEFAWSESLQRAHSRFKKVYAWLGAEDRLAFLHGAEQTHALHFAAVHRTRVYRTLSKGFHMKLPQTRNEEPASVPSASKLDCLGSPAGMRLVAKWREAGQTAEPHEVAAGLAGRRLDAARAPERRSPDRLRQRLQTLLGDVAAVPVGPRCSRPVPCGTWRKAKVEGYWLPAEEADDTVGLALWLLLPPAGQQSPAKGLPLVLGLAQAGKARFLAERAEQVSFLLEAGIAVALLDVRGTGETSPGTGRLPESPSGTLASELWMLSDSLPARQLKDVRTTLGFLAQRPGVDPARIGLWAEGFSMPNGASTAPLLFQETGFRQTSPAPKELVEPAAGWLAMAAALFGIEGGGGRRLVPKAVLVRGTLVSFASALESRHHYVPMDAVVPGILGVSDMADLAQALEASGVAVWAEDLRDGQNRSVGPQALKVGWGSEVASAYAAAPTGAAVRRLADRLRTGRLFE